MPKIHFSRFSRSVFLHVARSTDIQTTLSIPINIYTRLLVNRFVNPSIDSINTLGYGYSLSLFSV